MSEYLSEEEQLARARTWWQENGTTLMVGLVVAVAAVVGWRWYDGYSQDEVYSASRAFAEYQEASESDKAVRLDDLAREYGDSAYYVFALFDQARQAESIGDAARAEAMLEDAVDPAGDALLADLARLRLAKVQRELDKSDAALTTLSRISSDGYRIWVLEAKGDLHASRGEVREAHEAYQAASDALPEGEARPILEMKLENTAPFDGEYVQLTDALSDAVRAAEAMAGEDESIDAAANDADAGDPDAVSADGDDAQADEPATETTQ